MRKRVTNYRWSSAAVKRLIELAELGQTNPQIGRELGVSEDVVRHKRKKLKLRASIDYVKWTEASDQIVSDGVLAGESAHATAGKLGVSPHMIAR